LAQYSGNLRNAIIFTVPKQKMYLRWTPEAVLYSNEMLDEMAQIPTMDDKEEYIENIPRAPELDRRIRPVYKFPRRRIIDFLLSEGIAAIAATDGLYDDGTVQVTRVARRPWAKEAPKQPTSFILAAEHYNRIMRILEKGIDVEMEVELRAKYTDKDLTGHNIIAELPGTDLADEVVMAAAHFDGCVAGTDMKQVIRAHVCTAVNTLSILKQENIFEIMKNYRVIIIWITEQAGYGVFISSIIIWRNPSLLSG